MKIFFPFFKNRKIQTLLAPVLKLCEATLELCVPIFVAQIIDKGILSSDWKYILTRSLILISLGLAGLGFSVLSQYMSAQSATGFASGLRKALYQKVNSLSVADFDKIGSAGIITRMTGDVDRLQMGVNMGLRLFLRSPFIVFGAVIASFIVNVISATVFAISVSVLIVIVFVILLCGMSLYKKAQAELEHVTLLTNENVSGVRVLRAFAKEKEEIVKFEKADMNYTHSQIVAGRISALMNPLTFAVINVAIIALVYVSGVQVNNGLLTMGEVVALYNYMSQILIELIKLANLVITISKAGASGKRIAEFLSYPSSQTNEKENVNEQNAKKIIVFNNVSLYYGKGEKALIDINFEINEGETVGFLGGTGSGKSSIISLMAGFYDPSEGEILVNGIDIKRYPKEQLRSKMSLVMQKPYLMSGTIEDNITFGKIDANRIKNALAISQSSTIIDGKENGIKEQVLRGGNNFSGGQKQRLSIARALYKDAEILILDDCSSALDNLTEKRLREEIAKLKKTVIIASQRVNGLMHADKIVVLDEGKIVDIGTHRELIIRCPLYREIYELQNDNGGENNEANPR